MAIRISKHQLDLTSSHFAGSGSGGRTLTLADDAVSAEKLGFKFVELKIEAASFTVSNSNSEFDLAENALMDLHLSRSATLLRNGVSINESFRSAAYTLASENDWKINADGTKVIVFGDVTGSGDTYSLKYPVQTAGAGASVVGDFTRTYILSRTTVGAVSNDDAELTIGGGAPNGAANRIILENDTTSLFEVMVVARRTDVDGESASYNFKVCLDRNSTAASTAVVGGDFKVVIAEDDTDWDVNAAANTTVGGLKLYVTAEADKTIKWVAFVRELKSQG
jgi:hypothetical protein